MNFKHLIVGATMTAALAGPVFALDGKLVGLNGMKVVAVWKDDDAQSEGNTLIQAGVMETNPELLIPLLSCIVPSGTKAVITDAGLVTHDIMVIEGENAGCKGNVPMEVFDAN
jgi:hypothetical protein